MTFFITGTDTNIGKTLVCSWLCLHTGYDYFKPVQSGTLESVDSLDVQRLSGAKIHPETYRLKAPLSPHLAASLERQTIDLDTIMLPKQSNLIVEGAGGIFVPLNDEVLLIDLIAKFDIPVIIVARTELGTINHTLLTVQTLRAASIDIAGVIMSGIPNSDNQHAIETYGQVRVLATLPHLPVVTRQTLQDIPLTQDLRRLFT